MEGTGYHHTKGNKSDRERQISYDITYMWHMKKMIQMNLFTKQKLTHRQRINFWLPWRKRGERMGRLGVWD